ILLPEPKLILNATPGDHTAAATVFALIVTAVARDSAAEELGLRTGDLVYAINDGKTFFKAGSALEANETLKKEIGEKGSTIKLQIARCEPLDVGYKLKRQNWISYVAQTESSSSNQ